MDRFLADLTAKQYFELECYYELEPFGELRADYRAAIIAKTIADVNRGKDQKPYKIQDFIIDFAQTPRRKQTEEEQLAIVRMICAAYAKPEEPPAELPDESGVPE